MNAHATLAPRASAPATPLFTPLATAGAESIVTLRNEWLARREEYRIGDWPEEDEAAVFDRISDVERRVIASRATSTFDAVVALEWALAEFQEEKNGGVKGDEMIAALLDGALGVLRRSLASDRPSATPGDDLHRLAGVAPVQAPIGAAESPQFRDLAGRWAATANENERQWALVEQADRALRRSGVSEALWQREGDDGLLVGIGPLSELDERPWYGDPETIVALRADTPPKTTDRKTRMARRARVAGILAAFDDWQGRGANAETLRQSAAGLRRCNDLAKQLDTLASAMCKAPVVSLDGLLMKVVLELDTHSNLWNALAWAEERINQPDKGDEPSRADYINRDLLRIACVRGLTRADFAVGYEPEYRTGAEAAA